MGYYYWPLAVATGKCFPVFQRSKDIAEVLACHFNSRLPTATRGFDQNDNDLRHGIAETLGIPLCQSSLRAHQPSPFAELIFPQLFTTTQLARHSTSALGRRPSEADGQSHAVVTCQLASLLQLPPLNVDVVGRCSSPTLPDVQTRRKEVHPRDGRQSP